MRRCKLMAKMAVLLLGFAVFGINSNAYADESAVDEVTLTIPVSCSITSTVGSEHTATIDLGTYEDEIGETTFNVLCNDANGFAVYAIGYSDDDYGNTTMKPANLAAANGIVTGTATSGATSNWAMKLAAVSGTYAPTIATGFNAYHAVPDEYTKVASFASSTDAVSGSSFKSTYAIYISQAQPADTYTGKVKYTVVHPSNEDAPEWRTYMQNLSSTQCTSTPTKVYDNRDNHAYTIQRLLDGNCWMMENLDLGRKNLTTDLTSSNTNLSTTIPASTFNGWKKTTGYSLYDNGAFYNITGTDVVSNTPYGTLYNYYVASAGTISGNSNSSNAAYDICPAGWRLPTGGSSGEFQALYTQYDSNALMRASLAENGAAFALAGWYYGGDPSKDLGSTGIYWSSTRNNNTKMYRLFLDISSIGTTGVSERYMGHSIRCILKELTMQNVSSWGSSVQAGEEVLAKDARDGKYYSVARLADGNLWMTQNLDFNIDSSKTYTPADTDIPANWEPSLSTYSVATTTWNYSTITPESYDPGDKYWNGTTQIGPGGDNADYIVINGDYHYHLGNYYNWTAAVAMNDSSGYTTDGTLVDQSICPTGWTLPRTGYGDDTFYALISEYDTFDSSTYGLTNNTQFWISPTYMILAGLWDGSFMGIGSSGIFYSPVVYGSANLGGPVTPEPLPSEPGVYAMYLSSDGRVYPSASGAVSRGFGCSVRCMARPVVSTVTLAKP